MTPEQRADLAPAETGYDVLRLDPDYNGSCPYAEFDLDGAHIRLHCWRVCSGCDGCGIHVRGDRAIAERIKPLLDAMDWYGAWTIVDVTVQRETDR